MERARKAFDIGAQLGFDFKFLDVGGGFPGADVKDGITFEKVAAILGPKVDAMFPPDVQVIAEPGRFYVASAFSVCTHIIGRRTVTDESETLTKYMYYMNDGVYGSFNCILFDHQVVYPKVLMRGKTYVKEEDLQDEQFGCSLWGPTCDSIDCIGQDLKLPLLEDGDWLYFENMGAYTICAASNFNGFNRSKVMYTNTF